MNWLRCVFGGRSGFADCYFQAELQTELHHRRTIQNKLGMLPWLWQSYAYYKYFNTKIQE